MEMWETVEVWARGFIELEAVIFSDCGIPRLWDFKLTCCGGKKVGGGKL